MMIKTRSGSKDNFYEKPKILNYLIPHKPDKVSSINIIHQDHDSLIKIKFTDSLSYKKVVDKYQGNQHFYQDDKNVELKLVCKNVDMGFEFMNYLIMEFDDFDLETLFQIENDLNFHTRFHSDKCKLQIEHRIEETFENLMIEKSDAIALAQQLIKKNHPEAILILARALERQNPKAALAVVQLTHAGNPKNKELKLIEANIYLSRTSDDWSEDDLSDVSDLDEDDNKNLKAAYRALAQAGNDPDVCTLRTRVLERRVGCGLGELFPGGMPIENSPKGMFLVTKFLAEKLKHQEAGFPKSLPKEEDEVKEPDQKKAKTLGA